MIERIYKRLRWLYPKKFVGYLEKNLTYAGVSMSIEKFIPISFFYGISFGLLTFVLLIYLGYPVLALMSIFITFLAFHGIIILIIILIEDKRGKVIEDMLPDALNLISANIRSGLTPDKALVFAARPEFGTLQEEIKFAANKAMVGEPLEQSLMNMSKRIKSRIVEKTFALIVEGMKKGGEMSKLLDQTAEDIRNQKMLQKEIAAQVGMYSIFIFISVALVTPLLFGLSIYLMETMGEIASKAGTSATYTTAIGELRLTFVSYSSEFLQKYAVSILCLNSVFGGLLIGLLKEGNERAGIKYIPIIFALDILIFFITRTTIVNILTGVISPTATL